MTASSIAARRSTVSSRCASRGGQSVGNCPDRTAGLEHRRPLARAGCRRVSPLVVGRRSYRNTLALVRDVATRMKFAAGPLIVTDGFEFYGTVIRRVVGPAALDAQVITTRRHDRVVRVERRAVIGAAWRLDQALTHSEDSSTVNTSFIEREKLLL